MCHISHKRVGLAQLLSRRGGGNQAPPSQNSTAILNLAISWTFSIMHLPNVTLFWKVSATTHGHFLFFLPLLTSIASQGTFRGRQGWGHIHMFQVRILRLHTFSCFSQEHKANEQRRTDLSIILLVLNPMPFP